MPIPHGKPSFGHSISAFSPNTYLSASLCAAIVTYAFLWFFMKTVDNRIVYFENVSQQSKGIFEVRRPYPPRDPSTNLSFSFASHALNCIHNASSTGNQTDTILVHKHCTPNGGPLITLFSFLYSDGAMVHLLNNLPRLYLKKNPLMQCVAIKCVCNVAWIARISLLFFFYRNLPLAFTI